MEFCGVFYETGYLRAVYDRIRKLFFVFLMAAVLTVGMMGQGMETINFGSVRLKDMAGRAVAEYAAGVGTTGSFMISVTEIQISADVSADLFTVPAVISERSEDLNTGNSAAVVLPVEDAISDALMAEETISNILPGDKTVIGGGFVTDASGMICGISDLSVISEDGYLILPSEGCRGIAAGAFASCKDIISEIYIPANISEIEERAFTDLTSLGWIEMETSAGYYTEDGVLFSKDGTCLLAFPPARTGNYKVPSHVTEIADGAFDRAGISVLDASDCSVLEIRSLPSYIELRR